MLVGQRRPFAALADLPADAVRWQGGFWGERFARCRDATLPSLHAALQNPDNAAVLANFRFAAGLEDGEHLGRYWGDGDCYKWLEALARVYEVTGDPALDALMDEWIAVIGRAQDDDGYLSTQIQLTDIGRWQANLYHELYNMGHLLTAACVHHETTGKDSFLQIARKVADYLYDVFTPRPPELAHFGFNPSNIMGCVDLYRATGEPRYLELAGTFVDMRGSAPADLRAHLGFVPAHIGDQNQDRVPLRDETQAVGHAVTATYLYCGAADVFAEIGDPTLRDALERIWDDLTRHKLAVTGGVGELHAGASPRGDSVHEAFGAPYQLPQRTSYHETCANIGLAMWALRMLRLTGEPHYADVMERVLYNCLLSSTSIEQTHFFYTNPLARGEADVPLLSNDTPTRWATFHCYCCPPQVARTLAGLHHWAYSVSEQGLWVHLYGNGSVRTALPDGSELALDQATDYPWHGAISFTFTAAPALEFSLFLRLPAWAEGAVLTVNGEQAAAEPSPGTHVELRRV
ncbi:MAG: glycoside hydrolase family 127 protein [Armatimonadetes bacterium]|nr:glycoside hydrolase family 127 protein [Armatimonadota bacterium]